MRPRALFLFSFVASRSCYANINCLAGECTPEKLSKGGFGDIISTPMAEIAPQKIEKIGYRGDPRPPDVIEGYMVDGKPRPGFYPRPGPETPEKYNLLSHVQGKIENTAYVSTTTDIHRAKIYATPQGQRGYIYKIEMSTTFIDVNRSLRIPKYWGNMEFAAMEGIPYSQVIGYAEVTEEVANLLEGNKVDEIKFTENKQYKPLPKPLKGSTTRSELAEFPKGDKAWELEPWKKLKNAKEGLDVLFKKIVASEHPSAVLAGYAEGPKLAPGRPGKPAVKPETPEVKLGTTEVKPGVKPGTPEVKPEVKPGTLEVKPGTPKAKAKLMDLSPAKRAALVTVAKRLAEKEFANIASKTGLKAIVERRWNKDLLEVREKVLGYKKLSTSSPKLNPKGVTLKVGTGGLAAAGVGLWVKGMVDAFTTESSDWDKAAAVTAIIPFVGCGSSLVAQAEKADANGVLIAVDTSLCLLGDALLLGGATAPLGIIVHLVRFLIQFFEPPPSLPSYEGIKAMRDKPWQSFLDQHLTMFLASKASRDKLEGAVAIEALGIWSQAADRIGLLEAGSQIVLNASAGQPQITDLGRVEYNVQKAITQVWEGAEAEIVRRQRQYLLMLPKALREDFADSMKTTAYRYNEDFIRKLNADDMVQRYPGYVKAISWFIPNSALYRESRERMREAGWRLKHDLPQLPSLFTLAYFIGVAAGVDDPPRKINPKGGPGFAKFIAAEPEEWKCAVNATVIDPVRYYKEKTGREDRRVLFRHTVAVVLHLLGKIREADLPGDASGLSDVREFQMLLAMHVGNTFADWKEMRGNKVGYIHQDFENDMAGLMERLYDIPRSEVVQLSHGDVVWLHEGYDHET